MTGDYSTSFLLPTPKLIMDLIIMSTSNADTKDTVQVDTNKRKADSGFEASWSKHTHQQQKQKGGFGEFNTFS